jgi:hypothetical protein
MKTEVTRACPAILRPLLWCCIALAAACSGGHGGREQTPSPTDPPSIGNSGSEVDQLVASVPDLPPPDEVDLDEPGQTRRENGFEVVTHERTYSHGASVYPILAPHADVIYPGADVQGNSLIHGIPNPITAPRGGGTILISNNTGGPSVVELTEVGAGTVSQAINQIVAAQPERFPADFIVSVRHVRAREQLAIELGTSADYFGVFSASANFALNSRSNNTAFLVTLQQNFFRIAFERPSRPHEFYAPGTTAAQLAPHIGPTNPAAYLSEVTYGRVFYLLVQATDEAEDMAATLEANLQFGLWGGGASGGFRYLTDFHGLSVSAYAYGGDANAMLQTVLSGMENWRTLRESLMSSLDLGMALPVAYKVRSLATDELVKNAVTADYRYEVRSVLSAVVPELTSPLSGASLDNGCGIVSDDVVWSFSWSPTSYTDRYEIEVLRNGERVYAAETTSPSCQYRGTGARPRSGYEWRVRAHANGIWQPWSGARRFTLEAPNTDCPQTGVRIYTHPNYGGDSISFLAASSPFRIDLERINGWDDEIDSLRLTNCYVRLYEDPIQMNGGGANMLFRSSCPDVQTLGFRRNAATVIEFDLGFPRAWLDL